MIELIDILDIQLICATWQCIEMHCITYIYVYITYVYHTVYQYLHLVFTDLIHVSVCSLDAVQQVQQLFHLQVMPIHKAPSESVRTAGKF
jgi:hypothetical protein